MTCQTTRAALAAAWVAVPGLPAVSTAALQMAQAIAAGEGGSGEGCWGQCPGVCHNWGAVQQPGSPVTHDGSTPNCPAGSAPCVDTTPTSGGNVRYGVCFKTYADQAAGARDYLKTLVLRSQDTQRFVGSGNADAMARAMFESRYYHGWSTDPRAAESIYAHSIVTHAKQIAGCVGESVLVTRGDPVGVQWPLVALASIGLSCLGWAAWDVWKRENRR